MDAPGVLSRVSLAGLPVGVYVLRVQTESGVLAAYEFNLINPPSMG
jgi:hypothetical protein